ncbi:MAG: phosphoenolpyruvate--protein phosphotransferase [Planctomycetes bacterium]|nr:phosphoenolpyruvate--protein phosphotransferase [Planctomycetota bacterium]
MNASTGTRSSQSVFNGQAASPGVACGPAYLRFSKLEQVGAGRLRDDEVDAELGRLDSVARAARVSLMRQRETLGEQFTREQRQVFDTHLKMLEDPVIEADVRERVTSEKMRLEDAVKSVYHVYERLFQVVQSENLRNKMSDMRDVALRYLRHCDRGEEAGAAAAVDRRGSILVVRELSLSDLTEALENGVAAIVAEAGSLGSHGAILTHAAGIPAVIGVHGLREELEDGATMLVDGHAGQVVVGPTQEMINAAMNRVVEEDAPRLEQPVLGDGTQVHLASAVASVREERTAVRIGVEQVGLYRTELPVIQRQGSPKEAPLVNLYRQVVNNAAGVVFRLPDMDSSVDLPRIFPEAETNPALGVRGCRLLFAQPEFMRTQLRAMLRGSEGRQVSVAAPFVNSPADLASIRQTIDGVREELRLAGTDVSHRVRLGAVIETPAAALLGREILRQADFALIGLDALAQYLLAADRHHPRTEVTGCLDGLPMVVLRAVRKLTGVADALETEISVYGSMAMRPGVLELLVGAGVRRLVLPPAALAEAAARLDGLDLDAWEQKADRACHIPG